MEEPLRGPAELTVTPRDPGVARPADEPRPWEVRVGHHVLFVQGVTAEAAIEAARRRLMDDTPRMWDVISQLDPSRFLPRRRW